MKACIYGDRIDVTHMWNLEYLRIYTSHNSQNKESSFRAHQQIHRENVLYVYWVLFIHKEK